MNSLRGSLQLLHPHVPPRLISPDAFARILGTAEVLPASLSSAFGFECRLGIEAANADFALYTPATIGAPLLSGSGELLPEALRDNPVWKRVRELARRWDDTALGFQSSVPGLWLEFDIEEAPPAVPLPSIFISLGQELAREEYLRTLGEVLGLLRGTLLSATLMERLSRCIEQLPPGARVLHAGVMLSRPAEAVRLCLTGLSEVDIPDYLQGLEWEGSPSGLESVLANLRGLVDKLCLSMDVGEAGVLPRVGLECYLDRTGPDSPPHRERALLDFLVERSLCTREKREALLSWPGENVMRLPHHLWQSRVRREVSYLKLVHVPGRPLEAKAYFGAIHTPLTVTPSEPPAPEVRARPVDGPLFVHPGHSRLEELSRARDAALAFLAASQLAHGEFQTYLAGTRELDQGAWPDSSPFVTTFVLHALRFCEGETVQRMRRAALGFLASEMEDVGLWRYWSSRNTRRIGFDLDDTACASHALRECHPHILAGSNIPTLLGQRNEQGLFHTWVREPGAPNDIDAAVNANVLMYLGERTETEAVCHYLMDVIRDGREREACWYYVAEVSLHYMVSRAYHQGVTGLAPVRPALHGWLLRRQARHGSFGSTLDSALALCALHNLGSGEWARLDRATDWLLGEQRANGAWDRSPFYTGPEPPHPHCVWFGSEELTTALCLEAIARHPVLAGRCREEG